MQSARRSSFQSILAGFLAVFLAWPSYSNAITGGGTFDPFLMALKPALQMSPLPDWMDQPAQVNAAAGTIEVGIPALWKKSNVEMYAVTVVFDDSGDGGPVLEWRSLDSKKMTVISYGLGEVDKPVGLNSRTILVPQGLSREGGTLVIAYRNKGSVRSAGVGSLASLPAPSKVPLDADPGAIERALLNELQKRSKFESLISIAIRPARENSLAVLGSRHAPALLDENLQVFEDREVNGIRLNPLTGDLRKGTIVEAELSGPVEPLESALEFIAPLDGAVEGAMLRLETLGLDPEARLEVQVNNQTAGLLNFPGFELDDPSLVTDWNGRLILAGWRKGSLFVPARFFKQGDNSILISLKRSEMETRREVFLRNTAIHLRFVPRAFAPPVNNQIPPLDLPDVLN